MKQGRITISRPSYGDGRQKVEIRIGDESSGIEFLEIEIGLAEFAAAITGQGYVHCEYEARGLANIGKQRIIKTERVPYSPNGKHNTDAHKAAVAPFEVDGWECNYLGEVGNPYRRAGDGAYHVTFIRSEDAAEGAAQK